MNDLLAAGRVLGGRYRLVEEVARGGMARVWVAEDPILRRRVAVKILDPTLADDEHVRQRFRHEAIAAARLTHPGIVATYDTGEDDGVAYIVMELVDGTTLRRLLDQRPRLPVGEVADIGAQVADALDHAHSRGLVHRDVKPGNVLVERDGRVKVTDFGIAKAAGSSELTRAGAVVGTARYLAPEQVEGAPVDARTDVYALGLVLYEMLCGQTPFNGDNEIANAVARLRADPVPVGVTRPEVPSAVQDVVGRALARDPDHRPASAGELRDALAPFRRDSVSDLSASLDPLRSRPNESTVTPHPTTAHPTTSDPRPVDPDITSPDRTLDPSAPRGGHRTARRIVIGLLAAVGVVVLLVAFAGRGERAKSRGTSSSTSIAPPAGVPLRIVNARDYDPFGDNQAENPARVPRLYDGDPATTWETERYNTPDFGRQKRGVGVWFQLATPATVRTVRVHALDPGWSAELYVTTAVPATGPASFPPGPQVMAREGLPADATLSVTAPRRGTYLLLWITRLPASGKLRIAEVELAS
jgi:serine/threonine-protein kinase